MSDPASPPDSGSALYLALKGLAVVAELAMVAAVLYAAVTAVRYWPHISV